jgi:hypothetical protein
VILSGGHAPGTTREDRYVTRIPSDPPRDGDQHLEVVCQVRGASQTFQVVLPADATAQAVTDALSRIHADAAAWTRARLLEVPRALDSIR